ncbi:hypothetical protein ACF1BQ_036845 [Bradyrhizobium sp. RDT10]
MTYQAARIWIVKWSLVILAVYGAALLLAPALRYPLEFTQSIQLLQMLFPVFLGYLASATVFVFEGEEGTDRNRQTKLLSMLTRGPFLVTFVLSLALFLAFWLAHSTDINAERMVRFSFDTFTSAFALIIGIHTAVTSALVAYLFGQEKKEIREALASQNNANAGAWGNGKAEKA